MSERKECDWALDGREWMTDCGQEFYLNDNGTPEENGMKFCCFCGRPIPSPQSPETRSCDGTDVK